MNSTAFLLLLLIAMTVAILPHSSDNPKVQDTEITSSPASDDTWLYTVDSMTEEEAGRSDLIKHLSNSS